MKKAIYLTIEGGDGSGKSTLVKNLHEHLQKNYKVLLTAEFGNKHDPLCQHIRDLALSSTHNVDEIAGQILFGAICKQHQEKVIKPNLNQYDIILSDRGPHSNYAYGPVHGIPEKFIKSFFDLVYENAARPDITVFIHTPADLAFERKNKRKPEDFQGGGEDRVEQKGLMFQRQVIQNFLDMAKTDSHMKVVDVTESMTPEDVLAEVLKATGLK